MTMCASGGERRPAMTFRSRGIGYDFASIVAEQVAVAGGPPPPRQGEARPGPPETVGRRDRETTKEWRLTMRNFFKGLWQAMSRADGADRTQARSVGYAGVNTCYN